MQTIRTLHPTMSRGFWIAMTIVEVDVRIKRNYSEEVETDWNHEGVCMYGRLPHSRPGRRTGRFHPD